MKLPKYMMYKCHRLPDRRESLSSWIIGAWHAEETPLWRTHANQSLSVSCCSNVMGHLTHHAPTGTISTTNITYG